MLLTGHLPRISNRDRDDRSVPRHRRRIRLGDRGSAYNVAPGGGNGSIFTVPSHGLHQGANAGKSAHGIHFRVRASALSHPETLSWDIIHPTQPSYRRRSRERGRRSRGADSSPQGAPGCVSAMVGGACTAAAQILRAADTCWPPVWGEGGRGRSGAIFNIAAESRETMSRPLSGNIAWAGTGLLHE